MSKTMQVRISIVPFYHPSFKGIFPKLHRSLRDAGVEIDDYRVSLYHLITELERLLYRSDLEGRFREVIETYRPRLFPLQKAVEERIASARAAEIDPFLYDIEDAFEDLEGDLM